MKERGEESVKRSKINEVIRDAKCLFERARFRLPPFGYWTPEEWKAKGHEADEIRDNALGWDLADFGLDDFDNRGLLLFTIRNGSSRNPRAYPKTYAEKIMVVREGQLTLMHFHWKKREDIINRWGGNLIVELYASTKAEQLSRKPFSVTVDGVRRACVPGERVVLTPGESICLEPGVYHAFWGQKGKGPVVVGEVSAVNEDMGDNRFAERVARFPTIEEDERPLHLLCNEYPPVGTRTRSRTRNQ